MGRKERESRKDGEKEKGMEECVKEREKTWNRRDESNEKDWKR